MFDAEGAGTLLAASGVQSVDAANGGLRRGDLVVIAASQRNDAQALSERVAVEVATSGHRVAVINTEEESNSVTNRLARLPHGTEALERRSIAVPHVSSSFVDSVLDKARHCIADVGHDLVLIHPYEQVAVDTPGRLNAENAGHITRTCKALAKDHGAAVMLVCGTDKKSRWPTLGDLPADALEADADVVLLVYRRSAADDRVDVLLAKNRHERLDPATQLHAAH